MNNQKDKARQLVEKYSSIDLQPYSEFGDYMIYEAAKQCALIAIDEILNVVSTVRAEQFWKQVKQEIEKL